MPTHNAMRAEILEAVRLGSKSVTVTAYRVFASQQRASLTGHVLSQGKRPLRRNSLTEISTKKAQN